MYDRAGDGALLVLVGLADVEQRPCRDGGAARRRRRCRPRGSRSWSWPAGLGSWPCGKAYRQVRNSLRPPRLRPIPRSALQAAGIGATISGRTSLIEPRTTTSASRSIGGRLGVHDDRRGPRALGDRHAVADRVDTEGRCRRRAAGRLLGDRDGPVDHLGHERLAERDRGRLQDAAAACGRAGRRRPPDPVEHLLHRSGLTTAQAHHLAHGAVHLDDQVGSTAGSLVQPVDVLRDERVELASALELDEGVVAGVRVGAPGRRIATVAPRGFRTSGSAT